VLGISPIDSIQHVSELRKIHPQDKEQRSPEMLTRENAATGSVTALEMVLRRVKVASADALRKYRAC
jgi:hypothetical protein